MTKNCPVCRSEYKTPVVQQVYCSTRCRYIKAQSVNHGVPVDAYLKMRLAEEKTCPVCEQTFTAPQVATGKGATRKYCSERCQMLQARMMYLYSITYADYRAMLVEQDLTCALCETKHNESSPSTRLHVDHDHKTGKVRGLLCQGCNWHLGWYENKAQRIYNYRHGDKKA